MENATTASAREVIAVEPVIRRVVAARAANPSDVDDLVQDCLERLLAARERLAPEAVLPYAVVVARNAVTSHAKTAMRHAAATPRIVDISAPERPEDRLLAGEARDAMLAALAQLSDAERRDILAYHGDAAPDTAVRVSPGALRVRMARTRAKLRLEYLLAFRHIELPTPVCRGVLLSVSAGDARRQRELHAGQHLLDCGTCGTLSEPLDRRSIALTAIAVPVGLVAWAAGKARAHPAQATATAASAAAVAAAVAVAAVLAGSPAPRPAGPQVVVSAAPASPGRAQSPGGPASPAPAPAVGQLTVAGRAVSDAAAHQSLRSLAGRTARAAGATVVDAVTRNGFWIGSSRGRIWVQLVGPLRSFRVRAGDRVWFTATVVSHSPAYPAQAGAAGGDAALLARQGAHLAVPTTSISVGRPG